MSGRAVQALLLGACVLGASPTAFADGSTERVSLGQGNVEGNAFSESSAISSSGRYVAFTSEATNLVPGDTNTLADVFVRDRTTGRTERVSVSTGGVQGIDGISYDAHLSASGRWVAFRSQASTLVLGDTNEAEDAFVHDRRTGITRRVSLRTGGGQANGATVGVDISGDGRFVSFTSSATDLVPGDTNGPNDGFVHDRATGTTSRVNVGPGEAQCDTGGNCRRSCPASIARLPLVAATTLGC
jgi:tricorn protease-like protein